MAGSPQPTATKRKPSRKAFQTDLAFYARKCLRIRTKQAQLSPLVLNKAQAIVQERLTRQFKETGRVRAIILKARQEGVSTLVAARFYRLATLWPYQTCVVIGDKKERASTIFGIYERMEKYIPAEWKPEKEHYRAAAKLLYENDSAISIETAKDNAAGRGGTVQALHATELAFWEDAETVWIALDPSIPDLGSEVIIESTANGVGNLFHQMWEEATSGDSGYIAIFLPWWIHEEYVQSVRPEREKDIRATLTAWEEHALDVGMELDGEIHRLSIEQIEWRRTKIRDGFRGDERAFRQEFPSTAEEAFVVTGNAFFDDDALARYRAVATPPEGRYNLVFAGDAFAPIRSEGGHLRVWREPEPGAHYIIAADTATGRQVSPRQSFSEAGDERGGKDFCSADVFDVTTRSYVAQLHGPMAPEVFADQLNMLGRHYSSVGMPDMPERRRPALLAVEANHSSGETVLRILKDEYRYPRMYYQRRINRRTSKTTEKLGWVTSVENRQQILDDFSQALRENSIHLPNAETLRECSTFVRDERTGKPEATEGCHDDRVISAAIALQLARDVRPPHRAELPKVFVGTGPTGWSNQ